LRQLSAHIAFLNRILGGLGYAFILLGLLATTAWGQQLRVVDRTEQYTEYELRNDSLHLDQPFEFVAFAEGQHPPIIMMDSDVRSVSSTELGYSPRNWQRLLQTIYPNLSRSTPLVETLNPGHLRGYRSVSVKLHVMRPAGSNRATILKYARFRIYDQLPASSREVSQKRQRARAPTEPFGSGSWYKIPIVTSDIYQMDRTYLSDLGLDVETLNPQHIQLWAMRPDPLPHLNSAARPGLQELPILREGTGDQSMDEGDRLLFFAQATDHLFWNQDAERFDQRIHPYSDTSYVFLRVASTNGRTANPNDYANASVVDQHTTFEDVRWLEQELNKPEEDLKSGLEWLGESLPNNQTREVFRDTLAGLSGSVSVRLETQVAARSIQSNSIAVRLNDQSAGTLTPSRISSYNSAEGFAARTDQLSSDQSVPVSNGILRVNMSYQSPDQSAEAWVDWVRIRVNRPLRAQNQHLPFFSPSDGNAGEIHSYRLSGFEDSPYVLDVTDPTSPKWLEASADGNAYSVRASGEPGHSFWATSSPRTPLLGRAIPNQQITSPGTYPNYLIVAADNLLEQAQSWADYRAQRDGLTPMVVSQEEVFNAFSGGIPDVTAIRDFVRFLDQKAQSEGGVRPQYLLLFGDTSYDYKHILSDNEQENLVFTYQSRESYSRVSSYGSDDYFGLLDDDEGLWEPTDTSERLDIGIGRLPAQTAAQAEAVMAKWKRYEAPESLGDWRSIFTFAADDDVSGSSNDRDLHTLNAEGTAERLNSQEAGIRFQKIYELSYPAEFTSEGRRMPEATSDFIRSINDGTLVINYSGHGAEQVLSAERLFSTQMMSRLTNRRRPTIFVTATCSFGRYDDPDAQSGAEQLLLWPDGGAAAAFTTTRVVYTSSTPTSSNFGLNIQLSQQMLQRTADGSPQRLGDIYRNTKNTSVGASFNSRKFILLGDPAMRIGLPRKRTQVTKINQAEIAALPSDTVLTLPALSKARIEGEVVDQNADPLPGFQGEAQLTVLDAPRYVSYTDKSWTPSCYLPQCRYRTQNDRLFNGVLSVQNAGYNAEFVIPEDISYSDSTGRVIFYAQSSDGTEDAIGSFDRVRFNGVDTNAPKDQTGPRMDVYLNDQQFVNGALVNDQPTLIVDLYDDSGINTTGNGIGHEVLATIDTQPETRIVLNDYYQSEKDSYQKGRIEYPIESLPEGEYELQVEAWDVYNNPSDQQIRFTVADAQDLSVRNVFNYPNPMHRSTEFVFEHNQPGQLMDVQIRIYTLSGRPVDVLREQLVTAGTLGRIPWDGRASGKKLATGTYLYHIQIEVETPKGTQQFETIEKLVIIN
jgi:hypothetical protein